MATELVRRTSLWIALVVLTTTADEPALGSPCATVCSSICEEQCAAACHLDMQSDACSSCAKENGCGECLKCVQGMMEPPPADQPAEPAELDSMDSVVAGMQCDGCRASLRMVWEVSLTGPRLERGVKRQLGEASGVKLEAWSKGGPEGIARIVEAVCEPEVLPQRYHATRLGPGAYAMHPINTVVPAGSGGR